MSRASAAVVAGVVAVAAVVGAFAAPELGAMDPQTVALLILLVGVTEIGVLELFAGSTYAISAVPCMAAGMLLGVPGALVVAPASALIRGIRRRSRWYKILFNAGVYIIASAAAAKVFGLFVMSLAPGNLLMLLLPAALAGSVYYLHTVAVALAIAVEMRRPLFQVWSEQFRWLWPQYVALSVMAVLLATSYREYGLAGGALFVVPPLMMHYVAKQYVDRTLESARQVRELSQQLAAEDARRLAEAKYRDIFENAVVGIYQTTREGQQLHVNAALARIYGYDSPEEMLSAISDVTRQLYVDPTDREEFIRRLIEEGVITAWEVRYYCKDKSIIWVSESARAVYDADGALSHYEGTLTNITERKRAEAQARDAAGRLAEQAKVLALLEERERIAMDLHDGVIQSLYAVALGLGAQVRTLTRDATGPQSPQGDQDSSELRAGLVQAIGQINQIIPEIRNYIFGLHLYELGARGLRAGLTALAEELQVNALVRPSVEISEEVEGRLAPLAVANLLHLAREATSNVIRHAGASEVALRLARQDGDLVLTIHDNGRGFNPDTASDKDAVGGAAQGLHNMAERARQAGGRVEIASTPGKGTTVRVFVPLDDALPDPSDPSEPAGPSGPTERKQA